MMGYLLVLFIAVPIAELAILIKVGQFIGAFNTIMIVIFTGVAGAFLARMEGLRVLYGIQTDLERGILPSERLLDGLFIFCGGLLLLTPGLLTDCIGFLFLMPYTRAFLKEWLKNRFRDMIEKGEIVFSSPFRYR
jgi:UPF0716 protein FxsA